MQRKKLTTWHYKEEGLPSDVHDLILQQKAQLRKSHDEIKMLRDTAKKLEAVH
jgi:hypothetical protein